MVLGAQGCQARYDLEDPLQQLLGTVGTHARPEESSVLGLIWRHALV